MYIEKQKTELPYKENNMNNYAAFFLYFSEHLRVNDVLAARGKESEVMNHPRDVYSLG